MPSRGFTDIDISLSLRMRDGHLECAFVSTTCTRSGGQRAFLDSMHITGHDEELVDQALAQVRHQTLEHGLSPVEPF